MGDRCWLCMTFRKEDENAIVEDLGDPWYDELSNEGDSWREVCVNEANYALFDQRKALAKSGVCFLGFHGGGGEYGPALFASFDGEHADVPAIDGVAAVRVDEDGTPNHQELRDVWRYYQLLASAKARIGVSADPPAIDETP